MGVGIVVDEGEDVAGGGNGSHVAFLGGTNAAGGNDAELEVGFGTHEEEVGEEDDFEVAVGLLHEGFNESAQDDAVAGAGNNHTEARTLFCGWDRREGGKVGVVVEDAGAVEDGKGINEGAPDDVEGEAAPAVTKVADAHGRFCHCITAPLRDGEHLEVKGKVLDEHAFEDFEEGFAADKLHPGLRIAHGDVEKATGEEVIEGTHPTATAGVVDLCCGMAFASDNNIGGALNRLVGKSGQKGGIEVEVAIEEQNPLVLGCLGTCAEGSALTGIS